jgi:DNA-binding winged helix-turn-helix (wHTH) protein
VTKPFGIHELLARVRAALRSRRQDGEPPAVVEIGDLTIDLPRRRVRLAGVEVRLSRKEFAILRLLAQHAGRIVTHQHLLREVWGPAHEKETHYLRIYIGHLRQKLGDDPADPRYISNEPGVGYRLLDGDRRWTGIATGGLSEARAASRRCTASCELRCRQAIARFPFVSSISNELTGLAEPPMSDRVAAVTKAICPSIEPTTFAWSWRRRSLDHAEPRWHSP